MFTVRWRANYWPKRLGFYTYLATLKKRKGRSIYLGPFLIEIGDVG